MSKFLDLDALTYYDVKIKEHIESKKEVYIFDWDYTSNHNNVNINKNTADALYQAVEEGKLIVVRYQQETIPCYGVIDIIDDNNKFIKVEVIGSISEVIDNSTIHGGYFKVIIDNDYKLTSVYNELSYDTTDKGVYVLNFPNAFTQGTTQITPTEIKDLKEAIEKNKIILLSVYSFDSDYVQQLILPTLCSIDGTYTMLHLVYSRESNDNNSITHILGNADIDLRRGEIITAVNQVGVTLSDINRSFVDGSITNIGSSKVDLSLSRNKGTNKNISLPMATTTTAGLMTAEDKKKLDSVDNELFVVVEQLPDVANANKNKIYIVPGEEGLYNSWFIKDDVWTQLNSFNQDIDLSEYEKNIPVIVITYNKVYNPLETSTNEFNCNKTYQELLDIHGLNRKIIVKLYTKQGNYLGSTIDAISSIKSDDNGDYLELSFRYHGSSELRYTKNYFEVSTYKIRSNGTTEATSVCDDLVDGFYMDISSLVLSDEPNETNALIYDKLYNTDSSDNWTDKLCVYNGDIVKVINKGINIGFDVHTVNIFSGGSPSNTKLIEYNLYNDGVFSLEAKFANVHTLTYLNLNDGNPITDEDKKILNYSLNPAVDLIIAVNNEQNFKVYAYTTYANTGFHLVVGKIEYNQSGILFKSRSCVHSPGTSPENYVYNFVSNDYSISLPTGTLTGNKYLNDLGHFEDPFNTIYLTRTFTTASISDESINKISEIARTSARYTVYYGGQYSGFCWGIRIQQTTDAAEDTHYILRVHDVDIETRTKPIILEIDVNATAKTVKYTEIPIITDNDAITNEEIDDLFK